MMTNANERKTGFVPVQGGELYYEVSGSGLPLVMLHAGVSDHTMWAAQVEAFAPFYQVVTFDLRGYGKTTAKMEGYGYPAVKQDLLDLLQHLNIQKTALLGLSIGGAITLDFTLEYPDKIAVMIPVASGLSGFYSPPLPEENALFEQMNELEKAQKWAELKAIWVKIWADGPLRPPAPSRDAIRQSLILPTFELPQTPEVADRLGEIKVPTLVMWGDADFTNDQAGCAKMASEISQAQSVVFEDVAHMVNLEQPERFNRVVLDFLQQHYK